MDLINYELLKKIKIKTFPIDSDENKLQVSFLKFVLAVSFTVIFSMMIYNLIISKTISHVFIDLISCLFLVLCLILLQQERGYQTAAHLLLFGFVISSWLSLINMTNIGAGKYYSFSFPICAYFLNKRKTGTKWIILLLTGEVIIIILNQVGFITINVVPKELIYRFYNIFIVAIISYFVSYRQDVMIKKLYDQAYIDNITKLPNRNSLIKDVNKDIVLVGIVGLDDFKEVNAVFGYDFGFKILEMVTVTLKKICNVLKLKLYKLSENEFSIIGDGSKNYEFNYIVKIANSLVKEIERQSIAFKDKKVSIHISIGFSYNKDSHDLLLHHADLALKKTKKEHVSYNIIYNSEKPVQIYEDYLQIAELLHKGLEKDKIFPHFQPIISNETGEIIKYEALIRMSDNLGNIYSPISFLNCAKRIKIYSKLTRVMFTKIIKLLQSSDEEFSMNISYDDFKDPLTHKLIINLLQKNRSVANRLTFEVLETENIEDKILAKEFLREITSLGCKIAIDDFGSGYSNFDYLLHYNFDFIKIDGSLIKNIDSDKNSESLVSNIVNFAKSNNIKTIAEYVCNKEVYLKVKELGIDYSQGYYFGEPGLLTAKTYVK